MAYGGKREGAGRKARPSKKTRETFNADFDEQASAALPELFDTIKTIATGYKIAAYDPPAPRQKAKPQVMADADGVPLYVYTVPPDKAAAMYLVDRAAGKASVKNAEQTDTELTLEVTMFTPSTEEPDDEQSSP